MILSNLGHGDHGRGSLCWRPCGFGSPQPRQMITPHLGGVLNRNDEPGPDPNRRILPLADHPIQRHRRHAHVLSYRRHSSELRQIARMCGRFVHRCCRHSQSPPETTTSPECRAMSHRVKQPRRPHREKASPPPGSLSVALVSTPRGGRPGHRPE
jgi:hypothetical protein